jgi:DNA mismatch repair protein MutS
VRNCSTAVKERVGSDGAAEIVFLHRLVPGGASRSYGIQVARLAGLDKSVIARAQQMLAMLESGEERAQLPLFAAAERPPAGDGEPGHGASGRAEPGRAEPGHAEPGRARSAVERALAAADLDGLSPREAHALLTELQAQLGKT